MRRFLAFAATNTIEDVQAFSAQWAPTPRWVRTENVDVPEAHLRQAAEHLQHELGPEGIHAVGGRTWWQWRQDDNQLRAEWIEMRKDYELRQRRGVKCQRSMLYVHGGAYYFASVDSHRYQMQRHARKLQARVLAPRYRLAPEFPFPCGLMDCLAAYLYLLTVQEPDTIILAGDSAGGGMVLSMLVLIRDQGLPMPAGAILLSPWVDLTHSFPSVAGTNTLDYVPAAGFHHKPSMSWPPPNADDLATLDDIMVEMEPGRRYSARDLRQQAQPRTGQLKGKEQVEGAAASDRAQSQELNGQVAEADTLRIFQCQVDGQSVEIKDQIQFYAPNELLAHPLVSPIMQATLGGLAPLCILTGGGEMLRDEQIYLAHKAADPAAYPPPSLQDYSTKSRPHANLQDEAAIQAVIERYPPTSVQLQIWDDLCHVATTLSWTRPAKYMFRSVAQFGAWALARAQMSEIRILNDDEISLISTESSESLDSDDPASEGSRSYSAKKRRKSTSLRDRRKSTSSGDPGQSDRRIQAGLHRPTTPVTVGRAGDPLPLFKDHMIRQRVTRHGDVYALDPPSTLPATTMPVTAIGTIKQGPVKKWLAAQKAVTSRHGDLKREVQARRLQQMKATTGGRGMVFTAGHEQTIVIGQENPPPSALAGRSKEHIKAMGMLKKPKSKLSKGLAMWSGWGSKHDEDAIEKEDEKARRKADVNMSVVKVQRRKSSQWLGSGPIVGGGPLETGASMQDGGNQSPRVIAGHKTVPATHAASAQSATRTSDTMMPSQSMDTANAPSATTVNPEPPLPVEPTISPSNYPVIAEPVSGLPAATVPFKLARPADLRAAQASILTLGEDDGFIPDSATLPPAGYPQRQPIPSTLHTDRSKAVSTESIPHRLAVPGTVAAGMSQNTGSNTDVSRPSTADAGSSRAISPGVESFQDSLDEAQPAHAQAVRISHARASSKGDIDAAALAKLANIESGQPPLPNINGGAKRRPSLDREMTPRAVPSAAPAAAEVTSSPAPSTGPLHGAEKSSGGEIQSALADSRTWASDAISGVENASRAVSRDGAVAEERPAERPGAERFVTASEL